MKKVVITITGDAVADYEAAGRRDLEQDILPEKLGVKKGEVKVSFLYDASRVWYIWSMEHNAWWGHNGAGYTRDKSLAGFYSYEQALEIVTKANEYAPENEPKEAMIQANER